MIYTDGDEVKKDEGFTDEAEFDKHADTFEMAIQDIDMGSQSFVACVRSTDDDGKIFIRLQGSQGDMADMIMEMTSKLPLSLQWEMTDKIRKGVGAAALKQVFEKEGDEADARAPVDDPNAELREQILDEVSGD